jgi:hypothetical protein
MDRGWLDGSRCGRALRGLLIQLSAHGSASGLASLLVSGRFLLQCGLAHRFLALGLLLGGLKLLRCAASVLLPLGLFFEGFGLYCCQTLGLRAKLLRPLSFQASGFQCLGGLSLSRSLLLLGSLLLFSKLSRGLLLPGLARLTFECLTFEFQLTRSFGLVELLGQRIDLFVSVDWDGFRT